MEKKTEYRKKVEFGRKWISQGPMNVTLKTDAATWCVFFFLQCLTKLFFVLFFSTPTGHDQKFCGGPYENGNGEKTAGGEGSSVCQQEIGSGPIQKVEEDSLCDVTFSMSDL